VGLNSGWSAEPENSLCRSLLGNNFDLVSSVGRMKHSGGAFPTTHRTGWATPEPERCSERTALSETTALTSPSVIRCGMVETTAHLIRDHIASGARLMAREKEIITELKERGIDPTEAERTLAQLSACLLVLEKQWLAIWKKGNQA
jgi:hypothetical protein